MLLEPIGLRQAAENAAASQSTSRSSPEFCPPRIDEPCDDHVCAGRYLEWSRTVRLRQARFMLGSETNQLDWFRRILFSDGSNYSVGEFTKRVPYHLRRYDKSIQGIHGHRGEHG
jgi:hypothetical protein